MSSGGPISFARGGEANFVYYDAEKGEYYTQKPNAFGTLGMSSLISQIGQPGERNYIGSSLGNSLGLSPNFKASSVTPVTYTPSYVDVPGTTTQMPTQEATPTYSLNDSAQLLASVSPKIAEDSNIRPMARGGIADLGSYSDGGRMLRGPGDGM
jgi:hypothetical protein